MRILLPKTLCDVDFNYGPLFFLAGPVRGGDEGQAIAAWEIAKHLTRFYAALPCRYDSGHALMGHKVPGRDDYFEHQQSWERHYLALAATKGCVMFWLPCESKVNPRQGSGPYARDSYGELGEWRGRMMHDKNLRVVVGAEKNFHGLSQIKRNFDEALDLDFPIYPTLKETVAAAVAKVS